MGTEIVLGVLIVAVFIAISSSVKHFRGEGGCCGGSAAPRVRKKRLNQVVGTRKIRIEGMRCENCCRSVENGLNSIDQVSAKVDLKQNMAIVKLGEKVPDDVLVAAIEKLGYQVAEIE